MQPLEEADPSLPLGWEKHWDETYEEYYYDNEAENIAQWTPPTGSGSGEFPIAESSVASKGVANKRPAQGWDEGVWDG